MSDKQKTDSGTSVLTKNSAKKIQEYLTGRGFTFQVKELVSSTRTVKEAAEAIGCTEAQIVKSLVFADKITGELIMVVASGKNRVDLKKIESATGLELERAEGNLVKEKTGFAIGGIPPVGHLTPLRTILDPDLKNYPILWAAAGTPFAVFSLSPEDVQPLTGGTWVSLAE